MGTCRNSALFLNFQQVQADYSKKRCYKNTFEAVMCMKTHKIPTNCPAKNRTFTYKCGTFTYNRHHFFRKKPFLEDNVPVQFAFSLCVSCLPQPHFDLGTAVQHTGTILLTTPGRGGAAGESKFASRENRTRNQGRASRVAASIFGPCKVGSPTRIH